jgi:hypothetical protein
VWQTLDSPRRRRFDDPQVANLVISILEGATAVARINKRSAALDDAHRHLSLYLETVVRLTK